MRNMKYILFLTLIFICLFSFVSITVISNNPFGNELFSNIKLFKNYLIRSGSQEVIVMIIGDEKITKRQFDIAKALSSDKNEQAIYNDIVKSTVMKMVAKDKGVEVKPEEVFRYIELLRLSYEANPKSKDVLSEHFKALGVEEEEFWTSDDTYKMYYDFLVVSKLRSTLNSLISNEKGSNITYEELRASVEQEVEKLVDLKLDATEIKYFNR